MAIGKVLTRVIFPLIVILFSVQVLFRLRTPDETALQSLFFPDYPCDDVCVMGLRLGENTINETIAILEAHPWVAAVNTRTASNGFINGISWEWSGLQPPFIDTTHEGIVTLSFNGRDVTGVVIYTNMAIGDLWPILGPPESNTIYGIENNQMSYYGSYPHISLKMQGTAPCPLDARTFWHMQVHSLVWSWPFKPSDRVYSFDAPFRKEACAPHLFSGIG